MSLRDTILRHSAIVNRLRTGPATYIELKEKVDRQASMQQLELPFSKRTCQRDISDINSLYSLGVYFDFTTQQYRLDKASADTPAGTRLLDAFDLERISDLAPARRGFQRETGFNAADMFAGCFGIICEEEEPVQEVVLAFAPVQGKYVQSYPLHPSQQVVLENEEETRISLRIRVSHDFRMELLSHGRLVKVLQPQWLAKEMEAEAAAMRARYQ